MAGGHHTLIWCRQPHTPDAFDATFNGEGDAFVSKLDADGSTLVYSTFLGGRRVDEGWGIAVDSKGNAYVTGWTRCPDFPTTPGAFDTTFDTSRSGGFDAFVTKIDPVGRLLGDKDHDPKYSGAEGLGAGGAGPPSRTTVMAMGVAMAASLLVASLFLVGRVRRKG